MTHKKPNRKPH